MPLPVLESRRLVLRPYEISHLDALHRLWTDPDVRRYLWDDVSISRERAAQAVQDALVSAQQSGIGFWSLFQRDKEKLEGFCGLRYVENGCEVELLYGLAPALWKKGFATEAAYAVLEYAFARMHLERVYARSDIPNLASARVMLRLGMKFEPEARIGTLPVNCYSITRGDFLASRSKRTASQPSV
jgi:[ribosomal protein S5]-alanine N-acetyltransferase